MVRWNVNKLTTITARINKLEELDKMEEDGTFEVLPKKEVIKLKNEREKLEKNLGGIRS